MGKKILVVDDEQNILELVRIRLEKEGYEVSMALNGPEALEKCKNDKFDLIVLDIMMPEMDGFEVQKRLLNDLKVETPIMFLTAKSSDSDIWEGWQSGADYYVTKPFTGEELLRGVGLCLKESK